MNLVIITFIATLKWQHDIHSVENIKIVPIR